MRRLAQSIFWIFAAGLLVAMAPAHAAETRSIEERVTRLEQRVRRMDAVLSVGIVAAVICAWWAQNTGRNAWFWFFAGLIFSVISLLVLLYKNAEDVRARRAPDHPPPRT